MPAGSTLPAAAYFARIDPLQGTGTEKEVPVRLRIRIESPAAAPAARRHIQNYVTLASP